MNFKPNILCSQTRNLQIFITLLRDSFTFDMGFPKEVVACFGVGEF